MKQVHPPDQQLVTLSVRLTRDQADRLREVAEAEFRPVAAEMRRLIIERIEQHERDAA